MLEWLRLYSLIGLNSPILVADAIVHHYFQQFCSLEKIHELVKQELECRGCYLRNNCSNFSVIWSYIYNDKYIPLYKRAQDQISYAFEQDIFFCTPFKKPVVNCRYNFSSDDVSSAYLIILDDTNKHLFFRLTFDDAQFVATLYYDAPREKNWDHTAFKQQLSLEFFLQMMLLFEEDSSRNILNPVEKIFPIYLTNEKAACK